MERPIKGGYILISLGLIALSTSYSGSIDYDRISRTKKHIVLTGIKVGDTVMPDICVKPVYGNGTITFEDVYGFDVVVSSNNSVSVSEHVAPISGTKLYKHELSLKGGLTLSLVNASNEKYLPINYNVLEDTFVKATTKRSFISCECQSFSRPISVAQTGQYAYTFSYISSGQIATTELDFNGDEEILSETVTEL